MTFAAIWRPIFTVHILGSTSNQRQPFRCRLFWMKISWELCHSSVMCAFESSCGLMLRMSLFHYVTLSIFIVHNWLERLGPFWWCGHVDDKFSHHLCTHFSNILMQWVKRCILDLYNFYFHFLLIGSHECMPWYPRKRFEISPFRLALIQNGLRWIFERVNGKNSHSMRWSVAIFWTREIFRCVYWA